MYAERFNPHLKHEELYWLGWLRYRLLSVPTERHRSEIMQELLELKRDTAWFRSVLEKRKKLGLLSVRDISGLPPAHQESLFRSYLSAAFIYELLMGPSEEFRQCWEQSTPSGFSKGEEKLHVRLTLEELRDSIGRPWIEEQIPMVLQYLHYAEQTAEFGTITDEEAQFRKRAYRQLRAKFEQAYPDVSAADLDLKIIIDLSPLNLTAYRSVLKVIDSIRKKAGGENDEEFLEFLTQQLRKFNKKKLREFDETYRKLHDELKQSPVAAMCGECSDDGVDYFIDWVIGQGSAYIAQVYEDAQDSERLLSDNFGDEAPELELLGSLACVVYEEKFGEDIDEGRASV